MSLSLWPARRRTTAAALFVMLAASVGFAQQQLGSIQGTITDQTGAVLPGVTVEVTNVATNVARTTVSNDAGVYRMPSLDPGRYEVKATLEGFRGVHQRDVIVSVGATVGLNFQLQAGQVSELVEVVGHAPDIQTERAEVSAVVEQRKVVDLPLVTRNPLSLAGLQPGVTGIPSRTSLFTTEQGLGINSNGQRESGNNAQVDGVTISGGPWGGTVLLVPNVEAVQEFQIIANNPSAEYGRNAGAAVSIITKGGTNDLSGSVFEFHRSDALRNRNLFEERANARKSPFERNEFGVSIGGPIRRDRTFFFFSYEGLRQEGGAAAPRTVETEQLVNWVRANRPNSIAARLLTTYRPPSYPTEGLRDLGGPLPGANVWSNTPDGIPDVGTITLALPAKNVGDQYNTRFDQVLGGGNDRIRGSYYANKIDNPPVYVRPQFNKSFTFLNQLLTSGYTKVFSNSTLNELNFGWVRQHGETGDPTPESPTLNPGSGVAGFGVDFWHPITFTQNNFELRNTLTMNRGAHSFRVGGELRHGRDGATLHHWERPNYTFQNILDFIDDEPFSELRAVDPLTGEPTVAPGTYITNEWGLFVQDNWKMRQNLTLNLGLRYENFGNPSKKEGPFNGIILGEGATRQEQIRTARVAELDQLYDTEWNKFAPRFGVAWDPSGNAKFVVRAGAGVTYNRINNTVFSDERLNPPQFAAASASIQDPTVPIRYTLGPNYPPNPALGRGLDERGGIRGARVNLRVVDPDIGLPYVYNWFAGVQRELPWGFVLDVNYIGSAARNLLSGDGPGGENYNRFTGDLLDGRLDRLNLSFGEVGLAESRVSQDYNGLTTQLSRRYSAGFSFQVNYTLGKATDQSGFPEEVGNIAREEGPAGHDIRHSWKFNAIWEIPFRTDSRALEAVLGGWQLNAITVYQSGSPFSVVCGAAYPRCDRNADGASGERVSANLSDVGSPSLDEWLAGVLGTSPLDPNAQAAANSQFSLPAVGSLSTQARNAFRGPIYFNTDLSLFKNIRFPFVNGRAATVQLRLEAFNVFNRANLFNPVSDINNVLNFGRVTGVRDARIIQIGAKLLF